jgi:molecular chaperone GrpE
MSENKNEENNKTRENTEADSDDAVKTSDNNKKKEEIKELSLEEKLKISEDKLLRSLAEIENQRRRFEKEIKDAFEFGSFNFAKESLAILDNLQRAKEK